MITFNELKSKNPIPYFKLTIMDYIINKIKSDYYNLESVSTITLSPKEYHKCVKAGVFEEFRKAGYHFTIFDYTITFNL
jgi:hypothetical protein